MDRFLTGLMKLLFCLLMPFVIFATRQYIGPFWILLLNFFWIFSKYSMYTFLAFIITANRNRTIIRSVGFTTEVIFCLTCELTIEHFMNLWGFQVCCIVCTLIIVYCSLFIHILRNTFPTEVDGTYLDDLEIIPDVHRHREVLQRSSFTITTKM